MSVSDRVLIENRRKEHEELCKLLDAELKRFMTHAETLRKIKSLEVYKETHKTFEEFVQSRFGIERAHAYRLIDAAEVKQNLSPIGDKMELPKTESQYREVAKAPPEKQAEVVKKAAEKAAEENRKPTAKDYKQAVKLVVGELVDEPSKDEPKGGSNSKAKTLSKEEQVKANLKLAKDYIAKAINAIDDYNAVKPNKLRRADVVRLLQKAGENLW
jgi:hypothetical protein